MRHIGLFEGIGGFSLAAEWMGWETIAMCEILPFAQKVLKYHFPKATLHGDIKTTNFTIYRGKCDILTGGFPCQGFSVAGLRLGTDDNRYLWPEYLCAIDECQPSFVLGENVTGILSMEDKSGVYRDVFAKVESRKVTRFHEIDYYEAIYTRQSKMLVNSICEDLEKRGYEVQTFAVPAAGVGAPHKRERIWFVAYSGSNAIRNECRQSDEQRWDGSEDRASGIQQKYGQACTSEFNSTNTNGITTNPGCITGDRGKSEQRRYSVDNGQNRGREETADQPERSYQAWADTNSNSGFERLVCGNETYIGGKYKENAIYSNIGGSEIITDTNGFYRRTGQSGQRDRNEFGTSGDRATSDTISNRSGEGLGGEQSEQFNPDGGEEGVYTDTDSSGLQETWPKQQTAGFEQHGELDSPTGNDANAGRSGREEQQSPDFAAKSGDCPRENFEGWANWPTQSPVCTGDDGLSPELDGITFSNWRNESIKGGGNAVVPQVVLEFYIAIEALRAERMSA